MKAAETSASRAIADCTLLTVVSRLSATAEIDTFMIVVSTTRTNIAIASSSGSSRLGAVDVSDWVAASVTWAILTSSNTHCGSPLPCSPEPTFTVADRKGWSPGRFDGCSFEARQPVTGGGMGQANALAFNVSNSAWGNGAGVQQRLR